MPAQENKNLDFFEPRKLNNGQVVLSNMDRSKNIPFGNEAEIEKAKKIYVQWNDSYTPAV